MYGVICLFALLLSLIVSSWYCFTLISGQQDQERLQLLPLLNFQRWVLTSMASIEWSMYPGALSSMVVLPNWMLSISNFCSATDLWPAEVRVYVPLHAPCTFSQWSSPYAFPHSHETQFIPVTFRQSRYVNCFHVVFGVLPNDFDFSVWSSLINCYRLLPTQLFLVVPRDSLPYSSGPQPFDLYHSSINSTLSLSLCCELMGKCWCNSTSTIMAGRIFSILFSKQILLSYLSYFVAFRIPRFKVFVSCYTWFSVRMFLLHIWSLTILCALSLFFRSMLLFTLYSNETAVMYNGSFSACLCCIPNIDIFNHRLLTCWWSDLMQTSRHR
jgi:hypothetical protein